MDPRPIDRLRKRPAILAVAALLSIAAPRTAPAEPAGSSYAREALRRCRGVDTQKEAEQTRILDSGIALAERAAAADDEDAAAHFALFCNLAERVRRRGLGFSSLSELRRARRELDRALEIAPRDPDLLAAKGAVLLELPSVLGGDRGDAQMLLLRAFVADPDNRATRAYLEQALD